ncbi:hypothetical protein PMIT1323_02543 [Prochlorococcus marinus str. MIT 1323]|nr:hypothetical protein PMIT1323_02543 [Prochlorococcus marinus str. MIT 1323]
MIESFLTPHSNTLILRWERFHPSMYCHSDWQDPLDMEDNFFSFCLRNVVEGSSRYYLLLHDDPSDGGESKTCVLSYGSVRAAFLAKA